MWTRRGSCCESINPNSASLVGQENYPGGTKWSEPSPVPYSLPFFQASLFLAVLEDTLTEIQILVESSTATRLMKAEVDLGHLRALKYSVQQPQHVDQLDGVDSKMLHCDEYKIQKLDTDRKNLTCSIKNVYLDLALRKSYNALLVEVQNMDERITNYQYLLEEELKNKLSRREIYKQLRQLRNHAKRAYYDTDSVIDNLRTQVEDAAVVSATRGRYVDKWQNARTEQNDQKIRDKETPPSVRIEQYKQKCDQEQRVHAEVELITTIYINETLQKVEQWMNKYDTDMEAIELKIQRKKNEHVNMLERREGLEDTIEKHAKLINDWVAFKDAREKARLYREKMTNAAVTVQAWWRGLLVRNQLGPYKPQPKKKGPPEKGKKK